MTIRAEQLQIVKLIIAAIPIDVMQFQRDSLAQPFSTTTALATLRLQTISQEQCLESMAAN